MGSDNVFPEALYSQIMKCAAKSYFFDIREAKGGTKYLTVAESKIQDGQRSRAYMTLFPEQLDEFINIMQDMQLKLKL